MKIEIKIERNEKSKQDLVLLKKKIKEYFFIYANKNKIKGWCERVEKCKSELVEMIDYD